MYLGNRLYVTGRMYLLLFLLAVCFLLGKAQQGFVQIKGHQFILNKKPWYYVGANYWYGGLLGLEKEDIKGIIRLQKELDFLKSKGVTNLRVLAGTEGAGQIQGVQRIEPALQTAKGIFDENMLKGLDILLSEMGKRNMKAVIFLSNNWEWSGGFLQYLNWNGMLADSLLRRKLNWDDLRNEVSKFYSCEPCVQGYLQQADKMISRTNTITKKKYTDDAAIMSWELANEPRPMRPAAKNAYLKWIETASAFIKSKDKNHLVTTGSEGSIGVEGPEVFQQSHAFKNIDYLTIHIWPKNWGWFKPETMQADLPQVISKTNDYINAHITIAQKLDKPLVIEEFGLPRDGHVFSTNAATGLRDEYYEKVFSALQNSARQNGVIGGVNFWAFGGTARPVPNQTFWKKGDDYMGDPPMEEQGLNTVFDSDASTWKIITASAMQASLGAGQDSKPATDAPSDKMATKETVALYRNLKKVLAKGVMFGHQDDLAYGVGWKYQAGRSDVKETAGDYPAVYGWELGNIEYSDSLHNLDSVPFNRMKDYIKEGYKRRGIITISWHMDNPVNGQSAWDTTHAVAAILPGGPKHQMFKTWLDKFAVFINDLKGSNGEAIPILFRPYHEFTGNWFWWCKNTCTPEEFIQLWRFTVSYLQNEKKLHNLLYTYNTADFKTAPDFLERYPGDDMVDLVSFDNYQGSGPQSDPSFTAEVSRKLTIIDQIAAEKNKIPALAEAGYEAIPNAAWFTQTLLPALEGHRVSYVLLWRNHGYQESTKHMHYYAPYKGQLSEADFKIFYNNATTLFEKDIAKEKMYQ